jgi:large subunit ribosomal protein L22
MLVTASAKLKYVSIPPRKMRLVADLVKGLPVEKALNILNFTPRVAAQHIAKTLKSAAANALSQEGTDHLRPESLHVKQITVDEGPTAKRIRFQAMGRAFRYRKRYCHLTIVLEGLTDVPQTEKTTKRSAKTAGPVETGEGREAATSQEKIKAPAKKRTTTKSKSKAKGSSAGRATSKGRSTKSPTKKTKATRSKSTTARTSREK